MKHIGYSELTKRFYFLPVNGQKIDITDDINEIIQQPHSPVQALTTDEEAAEKWISDHGVKFMAIEQQRNAFLAGCTRVRAQQGEIAKQLQEIRAAFQWTFENMNTLHTSDHFNVPANGIAQIDQLLTLFSSQTKQP